MTHVAEYNRAMTIQWSNVLSRFYPGSHVFQKAAGQTLEIYPMLNKDIRFRDRARDEELIDSMVNDLIAENMPGTEGRSRDELESVVRSVHEETVARVIERDLAAVDAPAYEWRRVIEELKKPRA
jgi:hypothetical protein